MTSQEETILKLLAGKSRTSAYLGYYRGLSGTLAVVDVGDGGRIKVDFKNGQYRPEINEAVWVFFYDGKPFLEGPVEPKPGQGVVVTVGSATALVATDIGDKRVTIPFGATLSSGDTVKLYWSEGGHILSVLTAATPPPTPPAPGTGETKLIEFKAIDSAQYYLPLNKLQSNYPRASDSISGAFFYGTQIADTIPDTATVLSEEIYLPLLQELGFCYIGLHDQANTTPGMPASHDDTALSPRGGWVPLSAGWGAYLASHYAGITLTSGNGDNRWNGTQADGMAGCVRIKFQT